MEFQTPNPELLARYLAGECTRQECRAIENWLVKHPDNEQKLKDFKQIWKVTGSAGLTEEEYTGPQEEWGQLKERLNEKDDISQQTKNIPSSKRQVTSIHSTHQQIVRVAAILLIACFFGFLSYSYWSKPVPEPREPILRVASTAVAQRANLTLGDGSKVLLNADTKLEFPPKFASDIREVYLEGEAHFTVVSNPDKPFIIHSGGTITRVLGTSFAVRSYPEEKQVQVVVEEGRVSFRSASQKSPSASILTKNKLGRYLAGDQQVKTQQVEDLGLYLGWKKGILKFKEAPMSKVAREIERRYGVQVTFDQRKIAEMSLTAFLKSRSIRNVLDVMATSLNVKYRLEEDHVIFYQE